MSLENNHRFTELKKSEATDISWTCELRSDPHISSSNTGVSVQDGETKVFPNTGLYIGDSIERVNIPMEALPVTVKDTMNHPSPTNQGAIITVGSKTKFLPKGFYDSQAIMKEISIAAGFQIASIIIK